MRKEIGGENRPASYCWGCIMLKRDDPAFAELVADVQKTASSRYTKGLLWDLDDSMVWSASDTGVIFEQLKPADKVEVLNGSVRWNHYRELGLSNAQAGVIFSNVREGKPQEKWLEGIFDEAVLESHNVAGFKALVEHSVQSPSNHYFEELDGDRHAWADLSAAGKLQYIAGDAAICDVPFKVFAAAAKDVIGDNLDAALQLVFECTKELRGLQKLFPDNGRTESTPLIEQVKDVLEYAATLEAQEKERLAGKSKLLEGISDVLDGKPPEKWLDGAKALHDILHGDQPKQQGVKTQERGGREI
jgi:hypothetical protein